MNEMLLYAGFMNGLTSLFVPNLCSEQDNKVGGARKSLAHPHVPRNVMLIFLIRS